MIGIAVSLVRDRHGEGNPRRQYPLENDMEQKKLNYFIIYAKSLAMLLLLLLIFYWAAGEQLFYRESAGNRDGGYGNCITGELADGIWIDQYFDAQTDKVESVGVLLTSNGKEIHSDVQITLTDMTTGMDLASEIVSADAIAVNEYHYLEFEEGVMGLRGHRLKLSVCSKDGEAGHSAVAVYDNSVLSDGGEFFINGVAVEGTLSYSIQGMDDVWTGHAYPFLAMGLVLLLSALYWFCAHRFRAGKREPVFMTFFLLKRYEFLIKQIVRRDFKVKYKRSVLGMLWSLLNPLLTMVVQYVVFSKLFRANIENYPVYLLSGTVIFSFFTESAGLALTSIIANAALITKVYVPKYIYPVTKVLSSLINLLLSMVPLFFMMMFTGEKVTKAFLLLPLILLCVLVFTIGIGMLLSALMVFFRDMQFLWNIISMLWAYLTPLFYPESIIPEQYKFLHTFNPMYYYVKAFRTIVMEGISPEPKMYALCALMAFLSLAVGAAVFKKTQDRFALNI